MTDTSFPRGRAIMTGATRNIACASCGREIWHRGGRRPRFCSRRCRNRENGLGRVRKALVASNTRAPAKHRKNDNRSNALQWAKTLSSYGISGPADVLAAEVFSRSWQPGISGGGGD
jgi:hypothetical protein